MIYNNKVILFFLSIIFTSIPFIDFINTNFREIDFILNYNLAVIFILTYLSIFFIFFICKKISDFENNKIILLIYFSYWLCFKHSLFNGFIKKNFTIIEELSSELSLILIVLFIAISIYLVVKKNKFYLNFIFTFLILNLFASSISLANNFRSILNKKFYEENHIVFKNDNLKNKENIYFIILDAMMPLEDFEKYYNIDQKKFRDYVDLIGYNYIPNTKNFYGDTTYEMTSLFFLDKIFKKPLQLNPETQRVIEKDNLKEKVYKKFPKLLKSKHKSDLIFNLENFGYNFYWIGNDFAHCAKFNYKFCLKDQKKIYFDDYLFFSFLNKTPFPQIINKSKQINIDLGFKTKNNMSNDAISKFLEFEKKHKGNISENRPSFYFIHHMAPHWPYLTDENCNYKQFKGNLNFEGYKSSYLCVLKKVRKFIDYLNINDPNAFVVIQGDHNWEMSKLSQKKYGDRKEIFNLVKFSTGCKNYISNKLNNVNTMRFILSCISGEKFNIVEH